MQSDEEEAEVWTLEADDPKALMPEGETPNKNATVCVPVCIAEGNLVALAAGFVRSVVHARRWYGE